MGKTLNVLEDFAYLTPGDVLTLSEDGSEYVFEQNESLDRNDDNDNNFKSNFTARFTISPAYAKELIEQGVLEDPYDTDQNDNFVNIFDEIDEMLDCYTTELRSIPESMKNQPECLKVEKTTVLSNLIKTLNHLKSLRKVRG